MFGKNAIEKAEVHGDGQHLRVVKGSPFYTIQGEGPFSGDPAVFLRLHGCPLRCWFCDTEFSHPDDPTMHYMDAVTAIQSVAPEWCKFLVITGGEPVRQNLDPLVTVMLKLGWTIQVETAGILWQNCLAKQGVHIVVSPKTGRVVPEVAWNAVAFKYVVAAGQVDPADGLPLINTQNPDGKPIRVARPWDYRDDGRTYPGTVYLSPMDEYDEVKNVANRAEVARVAMQYGYRAGLQVHKHLNLP